MLRIFSLLILLGTTSFSLVAQSEEDSLLLLLDNKNLTEAERREIGLQLVEIYREQTRSFEDRYLEQAEIYIQNVPHHFDTLMRIAKDMDAGQTLRERSVELIHASRSKEAYDFLFNNLTDLVIPATVTVGEEQYYHMRYCFYILYQDSEKLQLFPFILSHLSNQERTKEYCHFVAMLMEGKDQEMLQALGNAALAITESQYFADNWKQVVSFLK